MDNSYIQDLQKIISKCTVAILYSPLSGEINYTDLSFPVNIPKDSICIPNNKLSDPFALSETCKKEYGDNLVCILIPGTRFDIYGTRIGKGGGWYDKFLSKVPKEWIRIGVCDEKQMSHSQISKEVWDQPVDWIITLDGQSWNIYRAIRI